MGSHRLKMNLQRSLSQKSTLSLYVQKSAQYSKWLGLVNVLVLMSSLSMVFYGVILRLHYHMTSIGYIDSNFSILPWLLIAVGVAVFIVSAFGLVVSATESKGLLVSYAAIMAVLCIALFATAFICILTSEK